MQVFSCQFCEISKNTYSYRTPPAVFSFWEVVGSGGYILAGGGWWWICFGWWLVVVDGGGW